MLAYADLLEIQTILLISPVYGLEHTAPGASKLNPTMPFQPCLDCMVQKMFSKGSTAENISHGGPVFPVYFCTN